jgi:hypothetical protein
MRCTSSLTVVVLFLALSSLVQVVLVCRATVPALDAVRFIETARQIDRVGLLETVRQEQEPPLFAACVWLAHAGVVGATGESRSSWAISAQLAAAIPLVLAVVPVYFLSLRLVGRAAAVAGALLFCVLPEVSRLGADGISDSTHLLLFSLALWLVVVYWTPAAEGNGRQATPGTRENELDQSLEGAATPATEPRLPARRYGSPSVLTAAGALAALAVLTRAEGLILPTALVAALVAFQLRARWRQPWRRALTAVGCLTLGCGLIFGPYLAVVEATTPEAAVLRILGRFQPEAGRAAHHATPAASAVSVSLWESAGSKPTSFATKETTVSLRRRGHVAAVGQFVEELANAFACVVGAFALVGLWRLRRLLTRPVDRFAQGYALLFSLVVIQFASAEGYLCARHLCPLVVLGIGCAGYGTLETGRWLAGRDENRRAGRDEAQLVWMRLRRAAPWCVVGLVMAGCLIDGLEPLHAGRLGHRLAAEWLASEADAPGLVLDTRGWTALYSGRVTYRYEEARTAFADPGLAYVVLERRELEYQSGRSRTLRRLLEAAAEPVAAFPEASADRSGGQTVVVYRWDPCRFLR